MSFVDNAKVSVRAGTGGAGAVSFRHEKFVEKGGPDGGDGGAGGSVVFVASESENTLASYRYQKELAAADGQHGSKSRKHGRNGNDLVLKVPVGTQIISNEKLLADLAEPEQRATIASGGLGGFGNAHFKSSIRQAPKFAEKGEPGEKLTLQLELKMIADVGLIGLPNVGKSTLLARLSNARPEIADYPFTTLTPNLGVVDITRHDSLLFADIPGLIEGAASGRGLGHEFLKHVERTAVLVHLIDAYQVDIAASYQTIQGELANYQIDLTTRAQIIAINKTEGLGASEASELISKLKALAPSTKVLAISASSGAGLDNLKRQVLAAVKNYRANEAAAEEKDDGDMPVIKLDDTSSSWQVDKTTTGFKVTGPKIEKFAARTDFDNVESVARLKNIMQKVGITHELKRRGAEPDDKIMIGNHGKVEY